MQIWWDFHVEKIGAGLQDLLPRFTYTDATADVLWSYDYEKEGVVEIVGGVTLVGPQWSCGALCDLWALVLALPRMTFIYLFIILKFKCEFEAPLKK